MTLEAVAKGFFGHEYTLLDAGREVGSMHARPWGDGAEARVDGRELVFDRSSFWSREFKGRRDGVEFASAVTPRFFPNRIEFSDGERRFELANAGLFKREYLIRHQGMRVGSVRAFGFGHRRIVVETPSEWPPELTVFALWLAVGAWRRRRAAAAAAGA